MPKDTHTVYLRVLEDETLLLDVKVGSVYALFQYNDRNVLVGRGIIPYFSPWAGYLLHLASAWELIMLSPALAYCINILKKEKEEAQNENIKLVQEQNVVLETKIKERTSELNHLVEELNQQTEELKIINERMKVLDEFKEGMTGMIVHDLKNLLNIILGLGKKEEVL